MTQVNNTRQHLREKESERFLVRSLDLLIGFRIIHESQSYVQLRERCQSLSQFLGGPQ